MTYELYFGYYVEEITGDTATIKAKAYIKYGWDVTLPCGIHHKTVEMIELGEDTIPCVSSGPWKNLDLERVKTIYEALVARERLTPGSKPLFGDEQ